MKKVTENIGHQNMNSFKNHVTAVLNDNVDEYNEDIKPRGKGAEITIDENTAATTIDTHDAWHAIYDDTEERFAEGFSTKKGERTVIGSIKGSAENNNVGVTAVAHECEAGDIVTIVGTDNFNGIYVVDKVLDSDNLVVQAEQPIDETEEGGAIILGNQIICEGNWGHKRTSYFLSGTPAVNNKSYAFALLVYKASSGEVSQCDKCLTRVRAQNATEYFNVGTSIIINWEEGDRISLAVKCETDDSNLTIAEADICTI